MRFSPLVVDTVKASTFVNRLKVDKKIMMDNSTFIEWNGCFVKGLYVDGLRRIPAYGVAPLIFGQAVHTGMKALVCGEPLENAIALAMLDAQRDNLDDLCDPRRNTRSLRDMLTGYDAHVKIMPNERLVPVELDGVKIVEKEFSFPIGTIRFPAGVLFPEATEVEVWWNGIMDMLIYYQNEIWVCDHKTTSVMGEKFADDKLRSSQMLGYTHIGRLFEERLGKKVRGVLINALALRAGGFEFRHFPLPMADWKIQEWHTETLQSIYQLVRNLVDFLGTGEAVPIREHCVTKYGKCKYFDLCENVPSVRERMIFDDGLFKENVWAPGAS
jgi:hypothetical protein